MNLTAVTRTAKGEKVRYEGKLPGVIYGAGSTSASLEMSLSEFAKMYKQAGESTLIDLTIDGKDAGKVLVQEVQHDPVSDEIIHVDLRRIDMNKPIEAPITINFIGESPAVKAMGGTLVMNLHSIVIRCLPKDLVSHVTVDLGGLTSFDHVIKVKDLTLPEGFAVVSNNPEDLVVKASAPMTEDELKKLDEESTKAVDLSEIKVDAEEKKKAEEAAKAAAETEEKK